MKIYPYSQLAMHRIFAENVTNEDVRWCVRYNAVAAGSAAV